LRKVVFVCQSNGFGNLWGLCAEPISDHPTGAVVKLDHEVGELEPSYPSLAEFVRSSPSRGRQDAEPVAAPDRQRTCTF
jgi:hypothetical protein